MTSQLLQKVSSVVIILGSLFFLIGAFSPISRVYAEESTLKKKEIIRKAPVAWAVSQFFFAAGAILTVVGIGLAGLMFREHSFSILIDISWIMLLTGTVFWVWHVYLLSMDPMAFAEGNIPAWLFIAYTLVTQAALVVLGFALLKTGLPGWVGWMMIGSMILIFILTLVFRDMPPLVYYIITLVTGIMIYRAEGLS